MFPAGGMAALVLSFAWPMAMVVRHGVGALALWTMHVADRLAAHPSAFAGEPWWEYVSGLLIQAMPWTPLAVRRGVALAPPRRRRTRGVGARGGIVPAAVVAGDRLLWAWSAAPMALLSFATVKNAHYAIAAQVPWSIWAALGLSRLAGRLARRGWTPDRLRRTAAAGFAALGLAYGLGFWLLGPRLDRRGVEWAFYESAARLIPPASPSRSSMTTGTATPMRAPSARSRTTWPCASSTWDGRRRWWRGEGRGTRASRRGPVAAVVTRHSPLAPATLYIIGRDRDRPALERLGRVEVLARGPALRFDRTYTMFRITPERPDPAPVASTAPIAGTDSPVGAPMSPGGAGAFGCCASASSHLLRRRRRPGRGFPALARPSP